MEQLSKKVLIVDDDPAIRRLLSAILRRSHQLAEATGGNEALKTAKSFAPDIVLLDVIMPGLDGYETCHQLKSGPAGPQTQVIMVSAKSSREEQLRAYEAGADDYIVKPIEPTELLARVQLHCQLQDSTSRVEAVRTELESRNSEFKRMAEERIQETIALQDIVVFTLAKLAESRDPDTGEHLVRMRSYSQILAEELKQHGPYASQIDEDFLAALYRSSPLHDIGKVGISDAILLKPGRLTEEEFEVMKQHTVIGANILDQAVTHSHAGGFVAMAAVIARFHHERFDGSGYPGGLVAMEIPLPARIVAAADVFDALTSARIYKSASSPHMAAEIIERQAGQHFDPEIVKAFLARFDDIVEVQMEHADSETLATGAMSFREYDLPAMTETA